MIQFFILQRMESQLTQDWFRWKSGTKFQDSRNLFPLKSRSRKSTKTFSKKKINIPSVSKPKILFNELEYRKKNMERLRRSIWGKKKNVDRMSRNRNFWRSKQQFKLRMEQRKKKDEIDTLKIALNNKAEQGLTNKAVFISLNNVDVEEKIRRAREKEKRVQAYLKRENINHKLRQLDSELLKKCRELTHSNLKKT